LEIEEIQKIHAIERTHNSGTQKEKIKKSNSTGRGAVEGGFANLREIAWEDAATAEEKKQNESSV